MKPDQKLFCEHINSASFQIGVDRGKWNVTTNELNDLTWPYVVIWIKAIEKDGFPNKYYFRFDITNYPEQAPTACPWNFEKSMRLEFDKWPKGGRVTNVFNTGWNNGNSLYCPCDRLAQPNHEQQWTTQFPKLWWKSDFTIVVYLEFIYGLLNSTDYANS